MPSKSSKKPAPRTPPDLDALLAEGQALLGLGAWDMTIAYRHGLELEAEAHIDLERLRVDILVLHPDDWHAGRPLNVPLLVGHELGHVVCAWLRTKTGTMEATVEEQIVETYARAFVRLGFGRAA